jgi:lysophospholipase L1-like esterase
VKIEDGQTILFTGDSITDCGRARPVGAGEGLGDGYVALVNERLAAPGREPRIAVLNTGAHGDTIVDLASRWETDVLDLSPDWLSVLIGINDVWRQFDPLRSMFGVPIDRYEAIYRDLLAPMRPMLEGLVLMAPYLIEPDRMDPFRSRMDAYGEVVERLAAEFDAAFVDVQAAFDRTLAGQPAGMLSGDRVHPNRLGHKIIADAFLAVVDLSTDSSVDAATV